MHLEGIVKTPGSNIGNLMRRMYDVQGLNPSLVRPALNDIHPVQRVSDTNLDAQWAYKFVSAYI